MEDDFFYQGCKKGDDKDGMRKNISEEDPPSWVNVQEKLFPRIGKGCLCKKILKKLGMKQSVIR